MRTLATLVSKSLLYYNQPRDRYEMHELLRQYGAEQLAADGELESAVRDRHSAHYLAALRELEERFAHARALPLEAIDADIENVRIAWERAVASRAVAELDQAVLGLGLYHLLRERYRDGVNLCGPAVNTLRHSAYVPSPETSRFLARMLALHSFFHAGLGSYAEARSLVQASQELLDSPDLAHWDTRGDKAFVAWVEGFCAGPDRAQQRRLFGQSLALFRALGHRGGTAMTLRSLADLHRFAGEIDQAKRMLEECLALYEAGGDQLTLSWILVDLGHLARFHYDYGEARRLFQQSLQLSQKQRSREGRAMALTHLGWLALFQGQFEAAIAYLTESAAITRELGNRAWLCQQLCNMATGLWLCGQFDQARERIAEARDSAQAIASPIVEAFVWTYATELNMYAAHYSEARAQARRVLEAVRGAQEPRVVGLSQGVLGWSRVAEGRYGEAVGSLEDGVAAFLSYNDQEYVAWSLAGLGLALHRLGEHERARRRLFESLKITVEMRAFIPLLHLMPVVSLVVAEADDSRLVERGLELYALAESHPFVPRAPLFADIAGQYIDAIAENRDAAQVEAARSIGGRRPRRFWPNCAH